MLDTRRLRVLCEVARHGSFSAAAEALGYTQPAVSRQIATLEAETGATLVRRVPQGALLTEAGRLLVERGNAILARLEETELELQGLLGLAGGRLRMSSFASAASSFIPGAILTFRERHPQVALEVSVSDPSGLWLDRLRGGELDLMLSHDPICGGGLGEDLQFEHLFDDPMYLALPADHPLARTEPLALEQFAGVSWLLGTTSDCPDSRLFLDACREAGIEPQIGFQHDDYAAVLGFVAGGVGVALVPDMATRIPREGVVIRDLEPRLPARTIGVAMPTGYRAPAAIAMLEILREAAAEWAGDQVAVPAIL